MCDRKEQTQYAIACVDTERTLRKDQQMGADYIVHIMFEGNNKITVKSLI